MLLLFCGLAAPVKLKTEWPAEGSQRPFRGIGLCGLQRDVVNLAWGRAATFTGAMAFPNNGCAICLNGDADPGDVDRQKDTPIFTGQDATGFDGLSGPTVKPENPVGLRDGVPALQVGEFPAIGLTGADRPVIGLTPQRRHLFC